MDLDAEIERRGSASYKWDGNERLFGRRDLLPFWVADMDFATPQPILAAIRRRSRHPVLGYELRTEEYLAAVSDWLRDRHGWTVPREWLMFCPPSSIVAINGLLTALTGSGTSVVVHTPAYGPLLGLTAGSGRRLIECPLAERGGRFLIDEAQLAACIEPDTRALIVCNPHNPTGRAFSPEELRVVARIADAHGLLVIADEVHCDLVLPGRRHVPYLSVGGERSVAVISPNKTFNTAGIPQATVIVPDPAMRRRFQGFLDVMQLNHDSTFGAAGMIAGYRQCGTWLDAVLRYIAANHERVAEFLAEELPAVRKVPAEATYLAWLDARAIGLAEDELMRRLVRDGGVGLYAGSCFGEAGRGFLRMNIACPRTLLERGLEGIRSALA